MRCFVAVWPPPAVVEALGALPRPAVTGLRWSTSEQWHITLRFFGELGDDDVARALTALSHAAGSLPRSVRADGGPRTRFMGPGLIVWPVDGLAEAATAVGTATGSLGQALPDRRFVGHVTIGRGHRGTDLRSAGHILQPLSASWGVGSISLVGSELHPRGARYHDIATFPFGHPPAER